MKASMKHVVRALTLFFCVSALTPSHVFAAQETNNVFSYIGADYDVDALAQKDRYRKRIYTITANAGFGAGTGIFTYPAMTTDGFHALVSPLLTLNAFATLRVLPHFFETFELSFTYNQANNILSLPAQSYFFSRSTMLLSASYYLKGQYFLVFKSKERGWNHAQLWFGAGPSVKWVLSGASNFFTPTVVNTEGYNFRTVRFAGEAVVGAAFSLKASPITIGFQVKYILFLAPPHSTFRFVDLQADRRTDMITVESVCYFNYWDDE